MYRRGRAAPGAGRVADHPLARMERIPPGAGRDHIQLVLTDRSRFTEGRDFSVMSPRTWRLADLGAKHSLLREGIGGATCLVADRGRSGRGPWSGCTCPIIPAACTASQASGDATCRQGPPHTGCFQQFVEAGAADRDMPGLARYEHGRLEAFTTG